MIRLIIWLWGILAWCVAIDSAMIALNGGKYPQPISHGWWTDQLLKGPNHARCP
jgi:hypothetical protein